MKLRDEHRATLLDIAETSIRRGILRGAPAEPDTSALAAELIELRSTFVTLRRGEALRGCIGSLGPSFPLAIDVARNAYNSAARDPRFPPVRSDEVDSLALSISVLTPMERITPVDRTDLLAMIEPGRHGLSIAAPGHRSTYLPKVWELFEDPDVFFDELLVKAGLPRGYWADSLNFSRYETEDFEKEL